MNNKSKKLNLYLSPELLAAAKRGSSFENLHYGWICVLNKDKKVIYKKGNISNKTYLRSALKPIQAIPVIENNLKLTTKELAVICASHSGSKIHLKILNKLIKKMKKCNL